MVLPDLLKLAPVFHRETGVYKIGQFLTASRELFILANIGKFCPLPPFCPLSLYFELLWSGLLFPAHLRLKTNPRIQTIHIKALKRPRFVNNLVTLAPELEYTAYLKAFKTIFILLALMIASIYHGKADSIPRFDHVVLVVMENRAYEDVLGDTNIRFINKLADSGALFTHSFAVSHPSLGNYMVLFSDSTQDAINGDIGGGPHFNTPNIGASLIHAGYSFKGFAQSMPYPGFTGDVSGDYAERHCPWTYWQGKDSNQIDSLLSLPMDSFPTDFSKLPTLSYVTPDLEHDFHNDSTPAGLQRGDDWVRNNLGAYARWALTHNSLLILTFDEDDEGHDNRIFTAFYGAHVKRGQYKDTINHYNVCMTLAAMYGVRAFGDSSLKAGITWCWGASATTKDTTTDTTVTGIKVLNTTSTYHVYPVPSQEKIFISGTGSGKTLARIMDNSGRILMESILDARENSMDVSGIANGMYILELLDNKKTSRKKIIISR